MNVTLATSDSQYFDLGYLWCCLCLAFDPWWSH